jgi:G3E family GTPase|tara:strand:+ start:275 stop:1291 length:1017 start_codon:yes stop_codon:yes gene_type:complete
MTKANILAVPTNIITGFLGVGKTSAILNLLAHKPADERWAILVNEFGEIGIDKSLFKGQLNNQNNVFIREVPGGCMCCAASLPMQIALNQLLAESRPHRLIIEPTGLGHPREVMQVLTAEHYQPVLSIHKTITLVDARKLSDVRYTSHDTFNQQLAIADVVVGNKQDLYSTDDGERLAHYVSEHCLAGTELMLTEHGQVSLDTLHGAAANYQQHHHHDHGHHHTASDKPLAAEQELPVGGMLSAENSGEGFYSVGWRFAPDCVFDYHQLRLLLASVEAERLKGVFITDAGIFGYNLTADGLSEIALDECIESRVEIIASELPPDLQTNLQACVSSKMS